jgi:hypothetical protein
MIPEAPARIGVSKATFLICRLFVEPEYHEIHGDYF